MGLFLLGLIMGALSGAGLARLALRSRPSAPLAGVLASPPAAEHADTLALAALRANLSSLRHDIRGILSPALLVSERLLNHAEPGVRRAGEVMVRVVDRATARLAESRQDDAVSAGPCPPEARSPP